MRCILKDNAIISFVMAFGFFLFFCQAPSFGQTTTDIGIFSPHQLKKLARRCDERGDYYTALDYMKEYYRKKKDDAEAVYYLAELFSRSKQYDSAIFYFSKPQLNNNKKFPLREFQLASLEMITKNYEEARKLLNDFRHSYRDKKTSRKYRSLARNYIAGCDSALVADTNQISAYVYNIGNQVNTPQIEFSPYPLSDDKILYGTLPLDSANVFSYSEHNAPVRQLDIARKKGKTWQSMGAADWGMNTPDYSTGNAALSPDGQRIYFTRCFQNWKYQVICHIYRMEKNGDSWSKPEKLNDMINEENYTATQPAVGSNPRDGSDILYFVSDRPGGKGGMDIWYSDFYRRKNTFKEPRNAGYKINTEGDEITPYYNTFTQTLYFSSNGLPGYGGFDIYRIHGSGRRWEDVEHIGTPVNSSYNDLYLALNADGNSGFFTSNRPGSRLSERNTCCDDIYYFNWKLSNVIPAQGLVYQLPIQDIIESINNKFGSDIKSKPEGTLLDNVPVYLYEKKENGDEVLVQTTKTLNGRYNFNLQRNKDYVVSIKNYGFFDKSVTITTRQYFSEDTLRIRKTGISHIPDIDLTMYIYYGTGKSKLTSENLALLDTTVIYLLDMLPNAIIEIGSHTDNIGTEDFNLKLSQKRADEVTKYLEAKGISEDRLVAKGYGYSQPIAPNQFPDGTDNPEGRRLNRRTQIRIIGTLNPNEDE